MIPMYSVLIFLIDMPIDQMNLKTPDMLTLLQITGPQVLIEILDQMM